MEFDAQGVVFNVWYLTYFDETMTGPLGDQLLVGVRWQDPIVMAVSPARYGRTSFALDFEVRRGHEVTSTGCTVYVVVGGTDGSRARQVKLLDVNLLLYAHNEAAPRHTAALAWLERTLSGTETVGFAWAVLLGFVRISTKGAVFPTNCPRRLRWILSTAGSRGRMRA